MTRRKELQEKLLREAEESRLASLEEARRREDRTKVEQSEDERRRAEENRRAEEEAAEQARIQAEEAPLSKRIRPSPRRPSRRSPSRSRRKRSAGSAVPATPPRPSVPSRRARAAARDDHRQRGKLTVTRALSDEDDSRARSLAALRRAREKEKRHHQEAGPTTKQVRDIVVPEAITVQDLANRMAERGADLVKALFKMGMAVTLTQTIDQDTAELLVTEFGHKREARQRERHRHRHVRGRRCARDACSRARRW